MTKSQTYLIKSGSSEGNTVGAITGWSSTLFYYSLLLLRGGPKTRTRT
ncbi:MAG: hypothetical protein MI674_07815 [Cytophagales bacterium]|nr:hypothetical protein [Cytophagales bacterium]